MNKRCKTTERIMFTKEEKEQMLHKSNGLCAHCGKRITVGIDFSVEHAIPISKGSSNDSRNMVALCRDCNSLKSDIIILKDIGNYYKHLNMESLLALLEYSDEFCEKTDWLSWDNWFEDDQIVLTPMGIPTKQDWVKHKNTLSMLSKLVLKKATYDMLDSVCEFYFKNESNRWLSTSEKNTIREIVGKYFLIGSIYVLQNNSQEVLGVFCISLNYFTDSFSEERCILPCISFPCVKKSYQTYLDHIFCILTENILNKCPKFAGEFVFEVANIHKYAYNVVENIPGNFLISKDSNTSYFMCFSFACRVTEEEVLQFSNEDRLGECVKAQSDSYKSLVEQRDKVLKRMLSYDNYNRLMGQ